MSKSGKVVRNQPSIVNLSILTSDTESCAGHSAEHDPTPAVESRPRAAASHPAAAPAAAPTAAGGGAGAGARTALKRPAPPEADKPAAGKRRRPAGMFPA